jgi:diguanylate cyclase (GGDEF)-like protein
VPLNRPSTRSFKLKLVGYFVLLSLLPAVAAFWGFSAVAKQSEVRRVDARLQSGLRAAVEAYSEDLDATAQQAAALANDVRFQAALERGDAAAAARLLRYPNLRVESADFSVGPRPRLAAERQVVVVGPEGPLGYVIASGPFDAELLRRVTRRSGLSDGEQFVVVDRGRVVAGAGWSEARLDVPADRPTTVTVGDSRYRVLVAATIGERPGATLGVLASHDAIDAATAEIQGRLLLGLLGALLVIALVAYFEGRSIVGTVSSIGRAANAIARGKLDERVPVRGRDELARLGNAFNQMADQLQQRLEELESERHRLREAVARFGDALAATHDTDQLLRAIVETAVEATGAAGGMLIGAEGQVVEVGSPGRGADQIELPLAAGHETFGTLFLFGRSFDEEARLTAASLVGQSVVALDNARLHRIVERQALVDGLTGLANRRQCEEALRTEVSRARRFETPLSIVVGDLDDFKAVNDAHGHPVGDTVMREFARILERSVRDVDVAARWGGEEFMLVLPGTDGEGALRLAQRIRDYLEGRTLLTPEGVPVRITASFGVAAHEPGLEPEDLVAAADSALYEAKRAGKNRVSLARGPSDVRNLR